MKLRWSMDEDDFKRLQDNLQSEGFRADNCYRGVAAGSMLWEFVTFEGNNKNVLFINEYEADTGDYGKLKDGTPYDHTDCYVARRLGVKTNSSFEDFKESVMQAIQHIAIDSKMLAKFESEMEPKWYGFKED